MFLPLETVKSIYPNHSVSERSNSSSSEVSVSLNVVNGFFCQSPPVKNFSIILSTPVSSEPWQKACVFPPCSLHLQALLDEVELIPQRLKTVGHADLSHVGFTDVVTLWAFFLVIWTQEVNLFLKPKRRYEKQIYSKQAWLVRGEYKGVFSFKAVSWC